MRPSPCHLTPLKFRRYGRSAGARISLVECLTCKKKYQISASGVLYDCAKHTTGRMKNYSIRLPRKPTKEEVKEIQDMLR